MGPDRMSSETSFSGGQEPVVPAEAPVQEEDPVDDSDESYPDKDFYRFVKKWRSGRMRGYKEAKEAICGYYDKVPRKDRLGIFKQPKTDTLFRDMNNEPSERTVTAFMDAILKWNRKFEFNQFLTTEEQAGNQMCHYQSPNELEIDNDADTESGGEDTENDEDPEDLWVPKPMLVHSPSRCKVFLHDRLVIGRAKESDLQIADDMFVSCNHAVIVFKHDKGKNPEWYLHDLQSTNGTFVNEQRVDKHCLSEGDLVRFGEYLCMFTVGNNNGSEEPAHKKQKKE